MRLRAKALPPRAEAALAQFLAAIGDHVLRKWEREEAARATTKPRRK